MQTLVMTLPTERITSKETFHEVFQEVFGIFDGYGRNGDAWIDVMSCLDDEGGALTQVQVQQGDLVAIRIDEAQDFERRCPALFRDLVEMTGFVNRRRVEKGDLPILTLLLSGYF